MTSHVPGRRRRAAIPLLVVLLGAALGIGGVLLVRPFTSPPSASSLAGQSAARALNERAIFDRLEPSIVDVTSTLRYDDETASGTGFIIDGKAGLVLTNNHVIRDATSVTARLTSTGKTYPAKIIGADVGADIALLQLQGAAGLPAAPVGNSAALKPGAPVLAIGNQAGQGGPPTIAPGIISSLNRTIQANDGTSGFTEILHGMLQTSAQIEPGDSGGPLADAAGVVIGVDTAAGTGGQVAGYAIPIDGAMTVARQIAAGRPEPGISFGVGGFLGVVMPSTTSPSPRAQAQAEHGLAPARGGQSPQSCLDTESGAGVPTTVAPARSGALVDGVLCGTGAATAGITAGDVITQVAGRPVSSPDALTAIVSACLPGTLVPVTWVSTNGTTKTSLVSLDSAPAVLNSLTRENRIGCAAGGHIWRRTAVERMA
jgi:S1-C subfamily serine protease